MIKNSKGYRNLVAWQKSNELAHLTYEFTNNFPKSELFGIISQMRRAALSVPANIAEGYSRRGKNEKRNFYQIALSSLTELEFYIDFSFERRFLNGEQRNSLVSKQTEAAKVLTGLIKSVN